MKNGFIILFVSSILIFTLSIFNRVNISSVVRNFKIRNDSAGSGNFGSSRSGGTRKHGGIDIQTREGESIYAPFDLTFIRFANPYKDDPTYTGALYKHEKGYIKIFYFVPFRHKNNFKKGDQIGISQSISEKWGKTMLDHIHFEMFDLNMNRLNPENYV